MRLTRLYSPGPDFTEQAVIPLSPDQTHYVLRVLRLDQDQPLILFNEIAGGWLGALQVVGKKAAVILHEPIQHPVAPRDIHLWMALVKKDAWGFILEKATELGVAAIQPVLTDYTQAPRLNEERARANLVDAAQQCERTHVPELFSAKKLENVLAKNDKNRIVYAALEREDALPLGEAMAQEKANAPATILIGPEGGFSQREKELLLANKDVRPVSLGPLILRADTAAIAALAIWQSLTV